MILQSNKIFIQENYIKEIENGNQILKQDELQPAIDKIKSNEFLIDKFRKEKRIWNDRLAVKECKI